MEVYFLIGIGLVGTSSYAQIVEKKNDHIRTQRVEGSAILKEPVFIEIWGDKVNKNEIKQDEEILFFKHNNWDENKKEVEQNIINKSDEDGLVISNAIEAVKETVNSFIDKSNWEGVVSIASYHDRSYYSPKQIDHFNEKNTGLGLGLIYVSEAKNEHSIKFLQIKDSERNNQQILGYQYMYNIFKSDLDFQVGFMGGISSRKFEKKDARKIMPVFMPTIGLKLWNVKLNATYVPKVKIQGSKYGGFFYTWGTYEFK